MKKNNVIEYPAVVQGLSSVGASVVHALVTKTNVKKILVAEKNSFVGGGNSDSQRNSQTLHTGRIEHYSLEKASMINEQAQKNLEFCLKYIPQSSGIYKVMGQNLLGVGEKAEFVSKRFEEFRHLYPDMTLLQKADISKYEPSIMKGRNPNEDVVAMHSANIPAINYGGMAKYLLEHAQETRKDVVDVLLNTEVVNVDKIDDYWYVTLQDGRIIKTKIYINATSGNAIYDLKKYWHKHPNETMLYGDKGYEIQNGDIGYTGIGAHWMKIVGIPLHNKWYQPQQPGLPMAEGHIDPKISSDLLGQGDITYGPTAFPTRLIEPNGSHKLHKFLTVQGKNFTYRGIKTLLETLGENNYEKAKFMGKHIMFLAPYFGNRLLLKEIQKLLPSVTMDNLSFPKVKAGIRLQELAFKDIGEYKKGFLFGSGLYRTKDKTGTFINSPSPGASVSIHIGEEVVKSACEASGGKILWEPKKQIIMTA